MSANDTAFIFSIKNEIERCHNIQHKWRSEFIARNAILTQQKHPLPISKYWQCVREELGFFDQLVRESIDYERLNLKKQRVQLEIDMMGNSKIELIDKKLLRVDVLEYDVKMLHLKRDSAERCRELKYWEKIKNEIVKENPDIDINDPESSQEDHWITRWKNDIKIGNKMMNPTIYRHALGHLQTYEGGV